MSQLASIDWDAELKNLLDDYDPTEYLHYIRKTLRDDILLNGGGDIPTLCGDSIPVGFHDETFARGASAKLPVCPECKRIYDGLPAGR